MARIVAMAISLAGFGVLVGIERALTRSLPFMERELFVEPRFSALVIVLAAFGLFLIVLGIASFGINSARRTKLFLVVEAPPAVVVGFSAVAYSTRSHPHRCRSTKSCRSLQPFAAAVVPLALGWRRRLRSGVPHVSFASLSLAVTTLSYLWLLSVLWWPRAVAPDYSNLRFATIWFNVACCAVCLIRAARAKEDAVVASSVHVAALWLYVGTVSFVL